MSPTATHLVLIPTYNTGRRLAVTVREALGAWPDVWVVVDGSTDDSPRDLERLSTDHPGLRVMRLPRNSGKGAAVLAGARAAAQVGFTHALVMDADGQHPVDGIPEFIAASREAPDTLILGRPVFGPDAPAFRINGRKLSVALVAFEIFGPGIDDPLFGFRVYPLAPLLAAFAQTRFARRFDFDPEMAVRLFWAGVPTRNIAATCRYWPPSEGGVSHFRYVRDNVRMVWLHTRLITQLLLWRWPHVARQRRQNPSRRPS